MVHCLEAYGLVEFLFGRGKELFLRGILVLGLSDCNTWNHMCLYMDIVDHLMF